MCTFEKKMQLKAVRFKKKPRGIFRASQKGFTIIELIVSVAIFSAVMLVAVGALLSMIDANRKAQSLKTVMNNLNFAVENMSRNMRVGTTYRCGGNAANPNCVSTPQSLITFISSKGRQISYRLNNDTTTGISSIQMSEDGGNYVDITAPEIRIEKLEFYVDGAVPDSGTGAQDRKQPRVLMLIAGSVEETNRTRSSFNIQTLISQRSPDITS